MPVINGVYLKDFTALPDAVADSNIIPVAISGDQVAYRTTVGGIVTDARVTGKLLTGLNVTGGAIVSTDSILTAFGKVQNQVNGKVPYTGATTDLDLGVHSLLAESITLDPTPATIPTAQGSMYFDEDEQTVAAVLNGSVMKIGEDSFFQIKNQSGSTIPKGTAVRFNGVVGTSGRVLAVPFLANGTYPSLYFLGVTYESIPDGGDGKALILGKIRGINTNAYTAGTILYASTTVAGGYQTTAPLAPNNIISVAAVVTQGTSNGTILVRPQLGSNINNDEGVKIVSPTTGDLLQLQSSGLWENKTISGAGLISGTGANGQVAFWNGTNTQTGSNNLFWDNANGRLGINRFNPAFPLDVVGQSRFSNNINLGTTDNTNGVRIVFNNSSFGRNFQIANNWNVGNVLEITPSTTVNGTTFTTPALAINGNSSNVGINTTTDAGFRLDVNGTARVQGVLTTTADAVVNGVSVGRGGGDIASNTRVGLTALNANTTGTNNTANGVNSLQSNTTGGSNTANGREALSNNTTGNSNTANGYRALFSNTTGSTNTANGVSALQNNTTGFSNTANGVSALLNNTTGGNNIANGVNALRSNTTGGSNTANGFNAGRFIADGTTENAITNNSVFLGADTKALANNQTNQIVIGYDAIGLGSNTTVLGNSSTTFGRWYGNLLLGSSTNTGQQLQVVGTSLLNGLSTIQGTTASDTAPLGAELLTTGTGDASWTGTDFATGYTHVAGSTTTLTSTLAGVVNTYYQITYTVTGRTAGSFTVDFGGQSFAGLTATGAVGPRATTTGTLVITPTSDFNGTIVLSIKTIGTSSASVTFNNSAGTVTNQIRISSITSNTFIGLGSGTRNTTGLNNSFFGGSSGFVNTTGINNSFFGTSSGLSNTTGASNSFFGESSGRNNITGFNNSFFGRQSGLNNTTGSSNSFFGLNSGQANTTGGSNSFFGVSSGTSNTTGGNNSFMGASAGAANTTGAVNTFIGSSSGNANTIGSSNTFIGSASAFSVSLGDNNVTLGRNAGRYAGSGTTAMTSVSNSIYLGYQTRGLNATGSTNEIVIGYDVVGLGSNTTVLGNSSTVTTAIYGNLLLGTTTTAGFKLDVNGTSRFRDSLSMGYNNSILFGESPYRFGIYRSSVGELFTYFDDEYDSALTNLVFRMRTSGTPINALTIKGTGDATFVGVVKDGGVVHAFATKSANYTLTDNDYYVTVTADATITLPSATGRAGKRYVIKAVGAGVDVTISTYTLLGDNENVLILFSDGSNWLTESYISGS